MKSRKSVRKRIKVTASGKVKRNKAGAGHLMSGKNAKRRRGLRKSTLANKTDGKRLKKLAGL